MKQILIIKSSEAMQNSCQNFYKKTSITMKAQQANTYNRMLINRCYSGNVDFAASTSEKLFLTATKFGKADKS